MSSPYYTVESILRNSLQPEAASLATESFDGSAYSVHVGVRWAARRMWRQFLNAMWRNVSRLGHIEFRPGETHDYLAPESSRGKLRSWFYQTPTSWSDLRAEVEELDFSELPDALLQCPEFVPFYCLALPHHFNSVVSDLLDHLASGGRVP